MDDIRSILRENPVLAILRNVPLEKTIPYAQAAFDGGVRLFEVAMNSRSGPEQIRLLRGHFAASARIGAGTVVNPGLAEAALAAGAGFLLAPSCPEEMLDFCARNRVEFLPGVLTPSEAGLCLARGFSTLKLFPAGDMPPGYVRSLKGPFDGSEYVAIGGVTPENAPGFLKAGYLGVGLGSNLFPPGIMENGDWAAGAAGVRRMFAALGGPAA